MNRIRSAEQPGQCRVVLPVTRQQVLAWASSAVLPAILLTACSSGLAASPPARTLDKTQRDELTWLVWSSDSGTRKDAYDAMVARFNQNFPNVTVTRIAGGEDPFSKLITMLAGNQRLDLIGTRPDWLPAYEADTGPKPLQDLRTYLRKDASVVKESDHAPGI
jgi:ABC-type glycerol-3-phosphate transport system substrate-binding protein